MGNSNNKRNLNTLADLKAAGLIDTKAVASLSTLTESYAIALTPAIHNIINPENPDDPIALQFVPSEHELNNLAGELADPISDEVNSPVPGIVHRYHNRALLKIVSFCPVYCRFCFRREMVGPDHGGMLNDAKLAKAIDYIAHTPNLEEIIMTGGDPLILSPRRISDLTRKLSLITHVKKLRWHTRVPLVAPERITKRLIDAITDTDRTLRIAVHANHVQEFSNSARAACQKLNDAGITLLSQSVLLRNINDNVEALEKLLQAYGEVGAIPYYLHHGDLAPGTSHFRTTIAAGMGLIDALQQRLSSQKIPAYILDAPGGSGKIHLTPERVECIVPGTYKISLNNGQHIIYRDIVMPEAFHQT